MPDGLQSEFPLGMQTPFKVAAAAAVRTAISQIENNWHGAHDGDDADAIHDLRVGTRRLRAALSFYEAAFSRRAYRQIDRKMARLTDVLGPARDSDVLIEHLDSAVMLLDGDTEKTVGIEFMVKHLQKERREQQSALTKAMHGMDVKDLSEDLESIVGS